MQVTFPRGRKLDFTVEKQVESARKRAFGRARAFCDGLDPAVFGAQPREDEAGLGEFGAAEEECAGDFHTWILRRKRVYGFKKV